MKLRFNNYSWSKAHHSGGAGHAVQSPKGAKLRYITTSGILFMMGVGIVTAFGINLAGYKLIRQNDQVERRINELIEGDGLTPSDLRMLQSLGPQAVDYFIPALTKRDHVLQRGYRWLRLRVPSNLRDRLPETQQAGDARSNAAALVGVLGPTAKFAVPYLADLLTDDAAGANAAVSLGELGPSAAAAIPNLIGAVERQVPFAATALGKIGNPARAVLQNTSQSGPPWQRKECEMALKQIDIQSQRTQNDVAENKTNITFP
jgi:hypothetical protein